MTFGAVSLQLKVLLEAGSRRVSGRPAVPRLPRPPRGAQTGGADAGADVDRRALASQAQGRTRRDASRAEAQRSPTAPATPLSIENGGPMIALALVHRLDRTLVIRARRDTVFQFFSDTPHGRHGGARAPQSTPRLAGDGDSASERRRSIGRSARGSCSRADRLHLRIRQQRPNPPGSSRVTIRLDSHPHGTLLQLTHEFAEWSRRGRARAGLALPVVALCEPDRRQADGGATAVVDRGLPRGARRMPAARERALAAIAGGGRAIRR